MYNKVELCGVNTGQLPVLTEAEKRQLLTRRGQSCGGQTCGWCTQRSAAVCLDDCFRWVHR